MDQYESNDKEDQKQNVSETSPIAGLENSKRPMIVSSDLFPEKRN